MAVSSGYDATNSKLLYDILFNAYVRDTSNPRSFLSSLGNLIRPFRYLLVYAGEV